MKLNILREHMKEHNISAVVIPTADMHLSEYISDSYKLREYLSGFTGSAGTLVVTMEKAGLWTDGRYYIQAEKELAEGITLFKASEKDCVKIHEFLKNELYPENTVGLDGRLFSKKYLDEFIVKMGGIPVNTDYDASVVWSEKPSAPCEKTFVLDEKYAGESVDDKITRVREEMKKGKFTHYICSAPECIMWLLNIRGNDVKNTPVALSYLIMTEKSVVLYIDAEKLTEEVTAHLEKHNIQVADYESVYADIRKIGGENFVAIDFSFANYTLAEKLFCAKKNVKDFIYYLKGVKNDTEIENIKIAYIKENVALTKAFYEIYHTDGLDECDVAEIIEKYRGKNSSYIEPSFDTIAAFGENAAMMHYSPEKGKCAKIGDNGLLLIDTGSQYLEGTTDTTRTLAIGNITPDEKEMLTRVLKGNINLTTAVFPEGTTFSNIDALARKPIWKKGLDYRCSTGHGVGYLLGVHEGPARISSACNEKMLPNMTVTNEPGVYIEGEFGIRIENHIRVMEHSTTEYGKFFCFEVLNFCPIGTDCLYKELLTKSEINWINSYNEKCRKLINPYLTEEEEKWLTAYTKAI